jgi:hypothetical protein
MVTVRESPRVARGEMWLAVLDPTLGREMFAE